MGSGFSGLAMGHYLKQAGIDSFVILEKAKEVGGTWRENTYPGAACDVKSHLYSYSFAPNPSWSRAYSPQREILAYLRSVADRHGLRPHLELGAEVRGADFDERSGTWTVRIANGESVRARSLVLGNGGLHLPSVPDLPGLASFEGPKFHSAEWDHGVDLADKRVAVIGTGASAIQIVPSIAPKVSRLHVFQRTPPWVVPRRDREISRLEQRLFARMPTLQKTVRSGIYLVNELQGLGFFSTPSLMNLGVRVARKYLHETISDPALRKKLTPTYRMGCKRILLSDDYYAAFTRSNVELVTDGIASITPRGVRTADGVEREVDVLVLCTGFRATEYLSRLEIRGAGGRELNETWRGAPETYLGITVNGFPNLFLLMGPNTGLGSNSMVFMIEAQARYAVQCVRTMREQGLASMDVRLGVQRAFDAEIQEKLKRTVWASGCSSWYQAPDGRIVALWPESTVAYWWRTRRMRREDYLLRPRDADAPELARERTDAGDRDGVRTVSPKDG